MLPDPLPSPLPGRLDTAQSLNWDVFCRVIDNFGDIGVCWRLARQLAAQGQRVRLRVDDASALQWMADGAAESNKGTTDSTGADGAGYGTYCVQAGGTVQVLPFDDGHPPPVGRDAPHVVIEAFGCEAPAQWLRTLAALNAAQARPALLLNLEYLSAEGYVQRCHGLPSPLAHGPGAGLVRWFFYPGFTPGTGGLLREDDLPARMARFDRQLWRKQRGLSPDGPLARAHPLHGWTRGGAAKELHTAQNARNIPTAPTAPSAAAQDERPEGVITLFCYEPPGLRALLAQLQAADAHMRTRLLVTPGRAAAAARAVLGEEPPVEDVAPGSLRLDYLTARPQSAFDELLWASDLNLVRGEDSLVRALWAGQALVWHIYAQDDGAHHAKLDAFLHWLDAPPTLRRFHHIWNGLPGTQASALPVLAPALLHEWRECVRRARARLLEQGDLVAQLRAFAQARAGG